MAEDEKTPSLLESLEDERSRKKTEAKKNQTAAKTAVDDEGAKNPKFGGRGPSTDSDDQQRAATDCPMGKVTAMA